MQKDHQHELLEAVCERFRNGEGVPSRFFAMNNVYLFIGDYNIKADVKQQGQYPSK